MLSKDDKRDLFLEQKKDSLEFNKNLIDKYKYIYESNSKIEVDLLNNPITLHFCEDKRDVQIWKTFVHLTSSLPWKGAVGRQVKFFVKCRNKILGMVHLTSPMAHLRVRDEYLNLKGKDRWSELNKIYNIETCVPCAYQNLLTGKLLVYCSFSWDVYEFLRRKYNSEVLGFETTSLYGKSSMYNRIPFLKYLGLTDGLSAVYISDSDWRNIKEEYYEVYPNTKTNRLAPVKYQIVDKLKNYYVKNNLEFPYEYESVNFKRGVYFGYSNQGSTEEMINNWKDRWLKMRLSNQTLNLKTC